MSNNVGALFKEFSANKQELLSFYKGDKEQTIVDVLASDLADKLRIHVQDDAIIKEKLAVFYCQNANKKSDKSLKVKKSLEVDKSLKVDKSLEADNSIKEPNVVDEFYNKWASVPGAIWCSSRMVIIPRGNEMRMITPECEIIY